MDRQEIIESIRSLRAELRRLLGEVEAATLRRSLSQADMNLHWSLWQLGYVDELLPEVDAPCV